MCVKKADNYINPISEATEKYQERIASLMEIIPISGDDIR
jgi:hypothetical protein